MRQLQRDGRLIAALILCCALFVRIAVPSGFMIGTDPTDGGPIIEICPGQGPMQMNHMYMAAMPDHAGMQSSDHQGHGNQGHETNDHPCAFAVAGAAVDLAAIAHPLAPAIIAAVMPGTVLHFSRPGLGLAAPPPPKTGPPTRR